MLNTSKICNSISAILTTSAPLSNVTFWNLTLEHYWALGPVVVNLSDDEGKEASFTKGMQKKRKRSRLIESCIDFNRTIGWLDRSKSRFENSQGTLATGGISGCQRLWRGVSCSQGFFLGSTYVFSKFFFLTWLIFGKLREARSRLYRR